MRIYILPFLACASTAMAATAAQWRSRSIYQVLTDRFSRRDNSTTAPCVMTDRVYCGGTWQGIINKLDYIQDMGFTAVCMFHSPRIEAERHRSGFHQQINGTTGYGEAFHGYWQNDIYALNSHFGTAADLSALSAAVHARGMYLMVDIVVNVCF